MNQMAMPGARISRPITARITGILRAAGIEALIVCGVTTEVCVESTVRDAFMRDYTVVVAGDCTRGPPVLRCTRAHRSGIIAL